MGKVYSNLKFLGHPEQLAALRAGGLAAPVHVRVKPINRCNHACWYCAYRADGLQLGNEMDEHDRLDRTQLLDLADDLIAIGVRAVTFSGGGEPLLHRDLPEVVRRLREGGIRVAALTNGANLQGAMAEAFARYGSWVRVSIDAWDDDSYAEARGIRPGAFTRLIDNLRAFAARRSGCMLGVSLIITEANHRHIAETCALLKEVGVDHVKLSAAVVANEVAANNAYHRRFADAVRAEIERARRWQDRGFEVIDHYHELEERFEKPYRSCPFLQYLTVVGADGCVYSCQDKAYTGAGRLGRFLDTGFRAFWFSDHNRRRLARLDPSRDCRHHCVAHQKNLVLHEILGLDPDHGCFV